MKPIYPKKLSKLLLIAVIAATLVSCANSSGNNNASSNGGIPGSKNGNQTNITIQLWEQPSSDQSETAKIAYRAVMGKVKLRFPNIVIDDQAIKPGTDYRQEYDKAMMAGEAPTAFTLFSYTDIPTRIKNGTIAEITDLHNSWEYKDKAIKMFDQAISTKDGKWYAIPKTAYVMGTIYNAKTLKSSGIDPDNLPKTWEDFARVGQKITNGSKQVFGYAMVGSDWNAWPFTAWVWSAGGEMVRQNNDGSYKIMFNDNPGVDAALFWNEMVWKYKITQKDVLENWNKVQEDIASGRAAFGWADIAWFSNEGLSKYGLRLSDFGTMPMPVKDTSITNPSFSGGEVITFNPKAGKDEIMAAFDVLSYIHYDEDVLKTKWKIFSDNGYADIQIPARSDLYDEKMTMMKSVPDQIKKDLVNEAVNAKAEPFCEHWSELKAALTKPLQQILLEKDITREKVKQILDHCADDLYSKYPGAFKR